MLYIKGNHAALVYRFESWVQYQSRRLPGRIDLTALAEMLSEVETSGTRWMWAWPNNPNPPTPWLATVDLRPTSIEPGDLTKRVIDYLATAPVTYDPHAPATAGTYS